MTTIYLTKKILSLNTSKIGLEKRYYLKQLYLREMAEIKKSLKKLITEHKVLNSCRLCLRPAEINIFRNKKYINLSSDIKNILNIEVKQYDGRPQYICTECITTLCKAAKLKQVAELAQWRIAQEDESLAQSLCGDNNCRDDNTNHDDEELTIYEVYTPKCKQCQKDPNNDCKCYKEDTKKPSVNFGRVCETCGLELKTISRLRTHMKTHSNEFNYTCGYCPYRTISSSSLKIHERSHTGVRPYACVDCNSTFSSASNLASHRRSHLPPAYKCDICERGFKFRQALLNHIASLHQSAKPYSCFNCEKAYATRKLLRRHERKAHNRPKMRQGAIPNYIKSQNVDEEPQIELL